MRSPRGIALVAALLVTGGIALLGAAPAAARTDDRQKPIIFIHGSDWLAPYGVSCPRSFGTMERRFRDWGHTGAFVTIAYYRYDTGCTASLGGDGSHTRHYASGHDATGGHTGQTDIRHLGYHLAWYIYDHYSKAGRAVDVVGHSMGPLLIQYALAQVARHHPDFPPRLLVEDVVSLAGPYTGGSLDHQHLQHAPVRPDAARVVVPGLAADVRREPAGRRRHGLDGHLVDR